MRLITLPMVLASDLHYLDLPGSSRLQRSGSLALVVILHVLLLLMLLNMIRPFVPEEKPGEARTITVVTVRDATPDTSKAAKAKTSRGAQGETISHPVTRTAQPSPSDLAAAAAHMREVWSHVIPLDRQQMASVDRAMTAPAASMQSADAGDADAHTDDSEGPGHGPNGETLYNARWYREPSNAELDAYLPKSQRHSGWGMIACRTVADYRVEDCFEIGQSPGSGLAGAVRQAAWQFRVFPPRIGGRKLVGSWVRIRIDYHVTAGPGSPAREAALTPIPEGADNP